MHQFLKHALSRGMILATAGFVLAACTPGADSPTGPSTRHPSVLAHDVALSRGSAKGTKSTSDATSSTSSLKESGSSVKVLSFHGSVKTGVSARAIIGPFGGSLRLPETGLTLVVPAGAVSENVTFSVRPVGGRYVAYDFEPHGMTFAKPLLFVQDLAKTNATSGMALGGAYFADPTHLDTATGTAAVSELFTLSFDDFGFSFFSITHFSGYLVSMA